ncbi:1-(5-phosphoribosyl)-5-[(5-phosphoribosylamino)methylideneamino] imidazole-4-carboxamide isomerase [Carex littledalei]|uniref:1-(5-phosphoribosyl)-5-[(5-phosphoribosylamino)methylideneamino] imidazole-4-carboxamide isomerase n=1 Tax=Carex littledalei TaxID=544730 RepID=A0A833QGT5_9POAL|nr:1-(5-phosphoribosyl)-5-[(5-phosphoribosylamino)methylideneamino] imidazole-4-carboxamide isomerase [Carex littledalei]
MCADSVPFLVSVFAGKSETNCGVNSKKFIRRWELLFGTNFESDKSAAYYPNMYKRDSLTGGHVIMLGADPLSQVAALEALHAYPGGLHVGGGINLENAMKYLDEGASHVIVTSYVFSDGKMNMERLQGLVDLIGRKRLVLDLSCRKKSINSQCMYLPKYDFKT